MQNKFVCPIGHVFFSPKSGLTKCLSCKLEAKQFGYTIPSLRRITLCKCGKEKSELSIQCKECFANSIRGKPIMAFKKKPEIVNPIIHQLDQKIKIAKKNIIRWEEMIKQYQKMD